MVMSLQPLLPAAQHMTVNLMSFMQRMATEYLNTMPTIFQITLLLVAL